MSHFPLLAVFVLLLASFAHGYEETDSYRTETIEGWRVRVSARLVADEDLAQRTLALLRAKLLDANRAIPPAALAKLRRHVVVWVERDGDRFPGMCYHPSAAWLRDNGFNPDKGGGIEVGDAANFLDWSREQPAMVIHELAHAWFDRLPPDRRRAVRDAYERATATGTYERVLRASGQTERAYAMNNAQEYFAELSEAYLGTNDFFPFVRAELARHDKPGYDAVRAAWTVGSTTRAATRPATTAAASARTQPPPRRSF
jgi:hypothetical protein